ncbi:MAG TPA: hypothetical protein VF043_24930 [Ktedonobacteraceae bacterium]
MRCANCDWPLSPLRPATNCPKCGTPTDSNSKSGITSRQQDFEEPVVWGTGGIPQDNPWNSSQAPQYSPYAPPVQPASMSGNPGIRYGTPQAPLQGQREVRERMPSGAGWNAGANMPYSAPPAPGPLVGTTRRQSRPGRGSSNSSVTRLGFTVAALCVIAGGLLLVFVYFMATGPAGTPGGGVGSASTQQTATSPASLPPSPSPTSAPSPTATTFPGQQYIDNAQTASAINLKTAQPTQLSTTFMVNQKIYVTFQLHPQGQSGAVCLLWYLDSRQVTGYDFPVSQYNSATYSYAIYGGTGSGSVEVYWASSTSCADKQLAQRVDFTVTQ